MSRNMPDDLTRAVRAGPRVAFAMRPESYRGGGCGPMHERLGNRSELPRDCSSIPQNRCSPNAP
jgi:hypothetical protein